MSHEKGRKSLPITKLLPPKKAIEFCYGTVDIETGPNQFGNPLGGPFVYGTAYSAGAVYHYESLDSMIEHLISPQYNGYAFYAHNGGKYDFLYFIQYLKDHHADYGVEWVRSGEQLIGFVVSWGYKDSRRRDAKKLKTCRIEFRDSRALLNASLDKLSTQFEVEHGKLTGAIDWENGETFDTRNVKHIAYAERDVVALYEILDKFFTIMRETFNVWNKPAWTASSYGRKAWQVTLPDDAKFWMLPKEERDFVRNAYYGGMVRVHKHHMVENWEGPFRIYSVDSNSHYPAQMLKGVPYGRHWHTKYYSRGDIGFYHVRVYVPEGAYTIIPKHNNGGTAFPTGEFETYCTSLELEFALEQGCEILEIYEGLQFEGLIHPFEDFLSICQALRKQYKGTAIEQVVKLMQNSVYGKFGQNEVAEQIIATEEPDEDMKPLIVDVNGEPMQVGNYYTKDEPIDDNIFHPEWAAWITASGRVSLSQVAAPLAKKGQLIYTDTDSIKFVGTKEDLRRIDLDAFRYGAYKLEKVGREMIVLGPKTYAMEYWDEKRMEWSYDLHAKGLPKKSLSMEMFRDYAGASATISGLRGGAAQLRRNKSMVEYYLTERKITHPERVLNWVLDGNDFTPIHIPSENIL